jgi:uncharacterized membrane protein YsdA (DUF1294 family)
MNYKLYFWIYLLIINVVSGLVFAYDKFASIKGYRRISEITLHGLEIAGGVYANLFLMFVLKHKNKKQKYYRWTWLTLVIWFFAVLMII